MKDYQRKINNKYFLPREVYNQTLWFIRDYPRMCQRMDEILLESASPADGMPHGGNSVKEVELKAERRDSLLKKTRIIEQSLAEIPGCYRKGVWDNIQHWKAYPSDADRTTYARWKSKFVYLVAVGAKIIDEKEVVND